MARSGSCSDTTASNASASPTRASDGVTRVLEEAGETLPKEDRVLGDHDPHGIATSTRVPLPRGLTISSVPPCAATRSRRPARPGAAADDGTADTVVRNGDVQRAVVLRAHGR